VSPVQVRGRLEEGERGEVERGLTPHHCKVWASGGQAEAEFRVLKRGRCLGRARSGVRRGVLGRRGETDGRHLIR